MHHVSLIIEFLRGRPAVVFWTVALTQAMLWTVIPAIFYSAPPGNVPLLLAIGHEFVLGSYLGPPLAFWLGEIAFRFGGLIGLYALSQVCIVTALWAVFTLGRSVVGTRHAVLGILLMVGIAAFAVPSPDFGPAVLAAPLWALALLHYWRAVGLSQRGAWFLLALDLGLLLLASYVGVILLVLLVAFTLVTSRGRRELAYAEPWIAFVLFFIVVAPHAAWLYAERDLVFAAFNESRAASGGLSPGTWLGVLLIASHLGLVLLAALASGWPRKLRERAPEIDRPPAAALGRTYVYVFALLPAACAVALAFAIGTHWPVGSLGSLAPLVLLSGLAVVVAAGDRVLLYREGLVSSSWLALLVAPPLLAALSLVLVPWIAGRDLSIAQPVKAEAQFFAENYQRRTGKPLAYITGDERLAPLIALMTPGRPRVFFAWAPQRSPWISVDDVAAQGSVLVWPAEASGQPPATLKTQFPDMVPELPRAFDRAVQGRLPPVRLGWSVLRPVQ
jgi:4-amino-4-deoxy-L-arabinose transferase-like glycosyltransferase